MTIALSLLGFYFLFGLAFALAFVIRGANAIDPAASNAGVAVRIMWLFAATMLWPYLLLRWLKIR